MSPGGAGVVLPSEAGGASASGRVPGSGCVDGQHAGRNGPLPLVASALDLLALDTQPANVYDILSSSVRSRKSHQ